MKINDFLPNVQRPSTMRTVYGSYPMLFAARRINIIDIDTESINEPVLAKETIKSE